MNSSAVRGFGKQSLLFMHSQTEFGNESRYTLMQITLIFKDDTFCFSFLRRLRVLRGEIVFVSIGCRWIYIKPRRTRRARRLKLLFFFFMLFMVKVKYSCKTSFAQHKKKPGILLPGLFAQQIALLLWLVKWTT